MLTAALLSLLLAADSREIIHIADWHWISEAAFVADGGTADDYPAFLDKVDAIQHEQMTALRQLQAKTVGSKARATRRSTPSAVIETLKSVKPPKGDSLTDQLLRDLYREDLP